MKTLIVMGGSSGGLDAVMKICKQLKPDFKIPIIIILHQKRESKSSLVPLLQSITQIKVIEPDDKEKLMKHRIYIVPPNYHLTLEKDGTFSYNIDEPVNYSRPSIDVLFESAAEQFGKHLAGVLLTGANTDGAEGMKKIKLNGGVCIVQNPETTEYPTMPQSAIDSAAADFILDVNGIASKLNSFVYF